MSTRVQAERYTPILSPSDALLNRVQQGVARSIDSILRLPYLDGVLLEDVSLTYGDRNDVAHKLGRTPQGFFVTRLRARPCGFYAYHDGGSAQSVAAATDTLLALDSELYDDGGDFDTSAYLFTAPEAGRYAFDGMFSVASDVDVAVGCHLYINSGLSYLGTYCGAGNPALHARAQVVRGSVALAAGDTVGLRGYHGSAAAKNLTSGSFESYLSGRIVGDAQPYEDSSVGASFDRANFLPLRVGRSVTADLWVF